MAGNGSSVVRRGGEAGSAALYNDNAGNGTLRAEREHSYAAQSVFNPY